MSNEELKEAALAATPGPWKAFSHADSKTYSVHTPGDRRCGDVVNWSGFDCLDNAVSNATFIASANPAAVLELLAELESVQQRIAELERERDTNEAAALAMRDEMRANKERAESAEQRITELESKYNG